MSMHVQIGDCTTPEAIPMLITLYYYYRGLLYWPRKKNLQEMDWEQWNNTARRRGQRAHKRSHATHGWKGTSTFGNGGLWDSTELWCRWRFPMHDETECPRSWWPNDGFSLSTSFGSSSRTMFIQVFGGLTLQLSINKWDRQQLSITVGLQSSTLRIL